MIEVCILFARYKHLSVGHGVIGFSFDECKLTCKLVELCCKMENIFHWFHFSTSAPEVVHTYLCICKLLETPPGKECCVSYKYCMAVTDI